MILLTDSFVDGIDAQHPLLLVTQGNDGPSSSRFISGSLAVNLPALGGSQDSAKRVVLPQASTLFGII